MRRRLALLLAVPLASGCFGGGDDDDVAECLQSGIVGETEADRCAALFLAALTCLGDPDGLQFVWSVASAEDTDTSDLVALANQSGATLDIPPRTLQAGARYAFTVDVKAPDGRAEHFEHAVTVLPRGPFEVNIAGEPVLNHYRSRPLTLTGETSGGECEVTPTFHWEQLGPSFVDFRGVVTMSAMLMLDPFATQANETYSFQLTSRAGEAQSSDSVQVNVVSQPLDVQISGGDTTVGMGSVLVLDAGGSRDPDLEVGGSDNLTYEWKVIDQHGVEADTVLPSTPIIEFDPVADRRLLDAKGVAPGAEVGFLDFGVTISGNGKVGYETARVHFVCDLNAQPFTLDPAPALINIGNGSSSFIDLVGRFDAPSAVTASTMHVFEWRESAHEVDLTHRVLSGGLDQQSVRLDLYGLPDSNYVFELDATLCGDVENQAVSTRLNAPPSGGSLSVSATSADTDDDIVFTASGWTDGDAGLTYQFSVVSDGQTTVLNGTPSSSPQITTRLTSAGVYTPQVRVSDALGSATTFVSSSTITVTSAVPPGVDEVILTEQSSGFSAELLAFTGDSYNNFFATGFAGTAEAATTVTLYTNPTAAEYRTVVIIADFEQGGAVGSIGVNYNYQPTSTAGCHNPVRSGGKYGIITRVKEGKSVVLRRYSASTGPLRGTIEMIVLVGNVNTYFIGTADEPLRLYDNRNNGTCLTTFPLHGSWAEPPPPSSPNPNPMEWRFEICPPAGDTTPCTYETYPLTSGSIYPDRSVQAGWSVSLRTINTDGASHLAQTTTVFTEGPPNTGMRFVELRAPSSSNP